MSLQFHAAASAPPGVQSATILVRTGKLESGEAIVVRIIDDKENGSWSLGQAPLADDSVAATALAILPFLAEGVTHRRSTITAEELAPYRLLVERGLQFLGRSQSQAADESKGAIGKTILGHTLATLALAEARGITNDADNIDPVLRPALGYLIKQQRARGGGWREQPNGPEELSTTVWDVMALKTARFAHVSVPARALKRAEKFLDDCGAGPADNRQSLYADIPGEQATPAATATGLFVRQLLGWPKSEPALIAGCEYLQAHLPPETDDPFRSVDYHFFATQVLRNMEEPDFDLWQHLVQDHLVRTQERQEPVRGSWRPHEEGPAVRDSRMYATAVSLLTLQAAYRNLPIYRPVKLQSDDPPDEEEGDEEPAENP